jgi:putative transcriptional regulator
MAKRDIGLEILEGIREIKAYKAGQVQLKVQELQEPASSKEIRDRLKLSQATNAHADGLAAPEFQHDGRD